MRKLIVLAIAVAVAFVAVPAFASVQNIKISGSIDTTYIDRNDFHFGAGTAGLGDQDQDAFITQTILKVDADLSDQVSAHVGLINERAWENDINSANGGSGSDSTVSLYEAYVTLREMLYSPLTVVVGRQSWKYGNSFIFDSAGTNNTAPTDSGINSVAEDLSKQKAQDAVRLILDYNPLTLEAFWSKINEYESGTASATDYGDIDLFGTVANYQVGDSMGTEVETYFFAKLDNSLDALDTTTCTGSSKCAEKDKIFLPGIRVSTNPIEGLNTQIEYAHQFGTKAVSTTTTTSVSQNRNANAAQFIANYQLPKLGGGDLGNNAVVQYVLTWVEGDKDVTEKGLGTGTGAVNNDGDTPNWTAWDPFFENQAGGTIYNSLFDLSGAWIHGVSLSADIIEDVRGTVSWTGLWLDKDLATNPATDITQANPNGLTAANATTVGVVGETALGNEVDVKLTYDYTEDVQLGLNLGWFIPGDAFHDNTDDVASQLLANINVNF
jgi:hypothetical protein